MYITSTRPAPTWAAPTLAALAWAAALILLVALAAACGGSPKPAPTASPADHAGGKVPVASGPQLYYCPPEAGAELCAFAEQAEGWVQSGDIDHLVGAGDAATPALREALRAEISAVLAEPPSTAPKLRSIACLVVISADSPAPDCGRQFALTFSTITEKEITARPGGILVLGYTPSASGAGGPTLSAHGEPEGPGRLYVMVGPNSNGCELPGIEANGCLGYKVFPVEVLARGQSPAPAPGSAETIAGIQVRPLEVGANATLPANVVVYLSPVPWATDSNPVLLWRVYRDPAGNIQRDDLFASLRATFGPVGIVSWAGDERMGELFVTTCPEGRCAQVAVGGWTGEFDVYQSTDGGMSWVRSGNVPAMSFLAAVTPDGALMSQFLGRDDQDQAHYSFFSYPSGRPIVAPAANTTPRFVPGVGLVWEPSSQPNVQIGAEPTYDAAGKAITMGNVSPNLQARLIAKDADGSLLVGWDYVPDRAADPHPLTRYIGRIDPAGKLTAIYSSGSMVTWRGPFAGGSNQLIGNADLPFVPTSDALFDVPAVLINLEDGKLMPLRELNVGLEKYQQPLVVRTVTGPVVRITGAGDCLNVREQPATTQTSLGCYRDGVLLGDRGESVGTGGLTWHSVSTPTGAAGWASAEFLDLPEAAGASAYSSSTRTGNPEIDPVLDAIASGDPARLRALVRFTPIACRIESGIGVEPFCPDGVAPGTMMEVFPVACAEGSSIAKANFDPSFLPKPEAPLYAIVRTASSTMLWSDHGYALIYSTPYVWGAQLYVDQGHITSFVSCGPSPADSVSGIPPGDVILPPR